MRFSPGDGSEKEFEKVIYEEDKTHWRTTKVQNPKRNKYYDDYDDYDSRDDWDDYNDR